jgi:hypothetical protein
VSPRSVKISAGATWQDFGIITTGKQKIMEGFSIIGTPMDPHSKKMMDYSRRIRAVQCREHSARGMDPGNIGYSFFLSGGSG